jgi:hypothetical protein
MSAPGNDVTAMKIRGVAYRLWRRVPTKEKEAWKDLYYVRHMDPKIYTKALKLLKKQGLVAKLEADCRHIVPTTSARPSQLPPPTFLEPARTSTAASREAPSLQHASNQSSRLAVPVLSEPASAAHSRRKDVANPQGSSDRSYSPPEFILSQHTISESKSIAHASCKATARARRLSNRFKCPQDVARSEHTSPEHPRSNGDAGSQDRSDSSSSPTPKPTLLQLRNPLSPSTDQRHVRNPRTRRDLKVLPSPPFPSLLLLRLHYPSPPSASPLQQYIRNPKILRAPKILQAGPLVLRSTPSLSIPQ